MKLVLDTSAYSLLARRHAGAAAAVRGATRLFLPAVCLGELHAGFRKGARPAENLRVLEVFLSTYEVSLLEVDAHVAEHYGEIHDTLRRVGTPIPTNDLWIAATCASIDGILLTSDQHFTAVPKLRLHALSAE